MKKYKLRLKDECRYKDFSIKNVIKYENKLVSTYVWITKDSFTDKKYDYTYIEKYACVFTDKEVECLPYGLISRCDLIEYKNRYKVVCPYSGNFLTYNITKDELNWRSNHWFSESENIYEFTKKEIEEKFPFYANDTCMVIVEDDK